MSVVRSTPPIVAGPSSRAATPTLETGDRLTRAEFERRYAAMPNVKKAELIGGIVYVPSPVRIRRHGFPHGLLVGWMAYYYAKTPGLPEFGDNSTVRLDEDNEPQPDLMLRLSPQLGGRSKISDDDYVEGPAEFVAEVATSSVSLDMHAKLDTYRRHGVREYLVWRIDDAEVDWLVFREGRYAPLRPDEGGLLKSEVFPGLWLDPAALVRRDLPRLYQVLDAGAATPEHAAFVERLRATS